MNESVESSGEAGQASAGSSSGSDDPLPRSTSAPGPDPAPAAGIVSVDHRGLISARQATWLSARAQDAMRALDASGEVRVRLVRDSEMADAHERHMSVAGTTDVITFNLADGEDVDADLLVCVDEAQRRAEAAGGIPVERELLLYVVHGMLHCLGYDDRDEPSHRAMHDREDQVLEQIGVGATFAMSSGHDKGQAS